MKKIASVLFVIGILISSAACSDRQKDKAKSEYYDTKESVEDTWDRAGDRIDRGADRVEDAWDDFKDDVKDDAHHLRRNINDVADTVKHKLD